MNDERKCECMGEQTIVDYVLGELDHLAARELEGHLKQCETCAQLCEEWKHTLSFEIASEAEGPSDSFKRRLRGRLTAGAAMPKPTTGKRRKVIPAAAGAAAVILLLLAVHSNRSPIEIGARTEADSVRLTASEYIGWLQHMIVDPHSETYAASNGEMSSYFIVNKPGREMLVWLKGESPGVSRDYQLWMIDEHENAYNGGVILWSELAGGGYLLLQKEELSIMKQILISYEPKGGSVIPTGSNMITVDLKPRHLLD